MDWCKMPPPALPISRVKYYRWVLKGADWGVPADVARHIDQVFQTSEDLRLEWAQRASKNVDVVNARARTNSRILIPSVSAMRMA
jgi:hypothetical protein